MYCLPLKSFFLSLATTVSIAFSLGLAYAIYTLVLQIKFFPFMNILASVIAVGKTTGLYLNYTKKRGQTLRD